MKPGEKLVKIAREKGVNQKELAEKMGVSPSTISDWGKGKMQPKGPNLIKAAEILGVSVDAFAEGREAVSGNVQTNNGIIGHTHAPVTIVNGSEHALTQNEIMLFKMFHELGPMEQAKALVYVEELYNKAKK